MAVFWGVIVSMFLGNLMLLTLNLPLIGMWVRLLRVPYKILFPLIILFCLVGAYSFRSAVSDLVLMMFFGCLGYLMKKYLYEPAPLVLAFVLGPMMETNLRQALIISKGGFDIFFVKPISLGCLLTAFVFLLLPLIPFIKERREKLIVEEVT